MRLVPHDRLLTILAASGVDSRVVVLVGRKQRVRVGQLHSVVPQGSLLCPLLFLVYVNDIWKHIESSIRLFAENCIIYRTFTNKNGVEKYRRI
jgi:hypothetical protein